jgi:hypothetical protein
VQGDYLSELAYPAELAGLPYSITNHLAGFQVRDRYNQRWFAGVLLCSHDGLPSCCISDAASPTITTTWQVSRCVLGLLQMTSDIHDHVCFEPACHAACSSFDRCPCTCLDLQLSCQGHSEKLPVLLH